MTEKTAPPNMFDADLTDISMTPRENLPYARELVTDLPYAESELRERIGLAIGAASACWENLAGAGVFESDRAKAIADDLTANVLRLTTLGAPSLGCATTGEVLAELAGRAGDLDYRTVGEDGQR